MRALIFVVLSFLAPVAFAQDACPARASWPTAGWPTRDVSQTRATQIAALEQYAFTLSGEESERKGIRTDGVVIIQGGQLIYERYRSGFDANKRHLAWSVSKSFTNALTGIAVGLGKLRIEDSICEYLDGVEEEKCALRIMDLLEMASGLDWAETYEGKSNQASSVLAMLYGTGRKDIASFVLSHDFRDPPGTTWMYSSGDTNVIAAALTEVLAPDHGRNFQWPLLFDRIGMGSAVWERDAQGTFIGSSYLYATPRDFAKFGWLFLNDGCWAGERILPQGWVADSTRVNPAIKLEAIDGDGDSYGRQWWLNTPVHAGEPRPWPDVPEEAYAARGHWGQSITVIPSLDLVIVRVGDDREPAFDYNEFLKRAIAVGAP